MARDFEDVNDIDSLPDPDLRALIVERLEEAGDLPVDSIQVYVVNGSVHLEGRVGTEGERQRIEHIITDVLGVQDVTTGVVVDAVMRTERAESAVDALAEDEEAEPQMGEGAHRTSDTAEHLLDTERDLHGTSDATEAVERGFSYTPPETPVQEGARSEEDR
jgi:hypothetical protein